MNDEQYKFGHLGFQKRQKSDVSWWIGLSREDFSEAVRTLEGTRMRAAGVNVHGQDFVIGTARGKV